MKKLVNKRENKYVAPTALESVLEISRKFITVIDTHAMPQKNPCHNACPASNPHVLQTF